MTFIKNTIKKEIAVQVEISDSNNNLGTNGGLEIVDTQKTYSKGRLNE